MKFTYVIVNEDLKQISVENWLFEKKITYKFPLLFFSTEHFFSK